MPNIHILNSDGSSYNYPLIKAEINIGRGKNNDIILADGTVSRNHAKIIRSEKDYLIVDLGSYNGTSVNGTPVQNSILKDKDQIKIGYYKLNFFQEDENSSALNESVILLPADDQEMIFP